MKSGLQLKIEGQEATWSAERYAWRQKALSLLHSFASETPRFAADDFRAYASVKGLGEPHHENVWGSLFTAGARRKWMAKSGDYDVSENPRSHAHHYVIWHSLLVEGGKKEQIRYELRASGKTGLTVNSLRTARSEKVVRYYCEKYRVKPESIAITAWTKPRHVGQVSHTGS